MMRAIVYAAFAVVIGSSPIAASELLDKTHCHKLRLQEAKFVSSGIKKEMKAGVRWAKANLPKARIDQVLTYIALREDILFRCPPPPPPVPERAKNRGKIAGQPNPGAALRGVRTPEKKAAAKGKKSQNSLSLLPAAPNSDAEWAKTFLGKD